MLEFDVCVVGAGPCGSAAASLLGATGLKVALVEAQKFPRYHIGESLLAASIPVLRDIGVLDEIEAAGFVRKRGSVFVWGAPRIEAALPMPYPHYAYQVERSRFDQIMCDHARRCGAQVIGGALAQDLRFSPDGRVQGVTLRKGGAETQLAARAVIDASGLQRLAGRRFGYTLLREGPKRLAVSCYFDGADRAEAPCQGDVVTEASENGWFWFIPLNDRMTSVGWVTDVDLVAPDDLQGQFDRELVTTRVTKRLLRAARQTDRPRRFRYENGVLDGPLAAQGVFLAGDAAGFIDPLFSTGIHSALHAARAAAAAAGASATDALPQSDIASWYDGQVRGHIRRIGASVRLIYSLHRDDSVFWKRRCLDTLSADAADALLGDLGPTGAQFFQQIKMQASHLRIPAPVADHLDEFQTRKRPASVPVSIAFGRRADIRLEPGLTVVGGRLRRGLGLRDVTGRAPKVCYPENGSLARLLALIDGQTPLGDLFDRLGADETERTRLQRFIGTLEAYGLLEARRAPGLYQERFAS